MNSQRIRWMNLALTFVLLTATGVTCYNNLRQVDPAPQATQILKRELARGLGGPETPHLRELPQLDRYESDEHNRKVLRDSKQRECDDDDDDDDDYADSDD